MRRKIIYWSLATVLFFALLFWWFWPREYLTPENIAKVKVGMSLAQVTEILSKPIDRSDYDMGVGIDSETNVARYYFFIPKSKFYPSFDVTDAHILQVIKKRVWLEKKRGFCVVVDDQGIVTETASFPVTQRGGGAWNWMRGKYYEWFSPPPAVPAAAPVAAPSPVPSKPAKQ